MRTTLVRLILQHMLSYLKIKETPKNKELINTLQKGVSYIRTLMILAQVLTVILAGVLVSSIIYLVATHLL